MLGFIVPDKLIATADEVISRTLFAALHESAFDVVDGARSRRRIAVR
jgi:hypothetical protein